MSIHDHIKNFIFILASFITYSSSEYIEESSVKSLEGIRLEGENLQVCQNVSNSSWNDFLLCSFVKIDYIRYHPSQHTRYAIIVLRDPYNHIEFGYKHPHTFFINSNGKIDEYLKAVDAGKWTRICLSRENAKSQVNLNINYEIPKKFPLPELQDIDDLKNVKKENISVDISAELPNKDLNVGLQKFTQICVGSNQPSSKYSSHFEIAGISVDEFSLSKVNFENCFEATEKLSLLDWELYNVSKELYSVEDLCIDTYVISYINKSGSYADHHQMCKHLNGRFISEDEIKHFEKYFIAFWETVREESYSDEVGLWLPGGNTKAMTLKSICYFFYFDTYANENSTQGSYEVPCIVDMISTVCVSPAYTDFTFYGALTKYDTNYFLKGENFSFYLEGDELSYIKMKNDKWVLGSELHRETCETKRALPVGRNKWEIKNENVSKILTFTHCKRNEFACTNGECLPWYYRCNGVVECTDKTDEELCQPIRKEKGYVVERTPPSRKHESKFKIFYITLIFNIADITSEKGIAVVDVLISLSWYDPRIYFWNPVKGHKINCDEIWSPLLSMADNARSGFQISFESYRSSCQIFTSGQEKDIKRKYSFKDPYMGTFVKGKDMKITYVFSGLVTVPCRFNLRKYPFGTQTCNISFWADNAYLTKQYEFVHDDGKYKDYTTYEGRKDLGEYLFISADDVIENSYFVTIIIKLKNLYGFHMLNSFAPSFLICVITFGTLFFPLTYFSERVSISLTALLVLAALFTQASDKSVITPYFKLLDIWYVVLIFYCFMIVIYNIALNKVMSLEERKAKKAALRSKQEFQTRNDEFENLVLSECKKRVANYNLIAIIFFAVSYLTFLLFFCLAAAGII